MAKTRHDLLPTVGLGLASTVLGAIGLMLFVLPILGAPISACGLLVGLTGVMASVARRNMDVRLCVSGMALCSLALTIDMAVAYAPSGFIGPQMAPPMGPDLPERSYFPSPARPV
jgi:hypothetical protein